MRLCRVLALASGLCLLSSCRAESEGQAVAPADSAPGTKTGEPSGDSSSAPGDATAPVDPGAPGPIEVAVDDAATLEVLDGTCKLAIRRYRPARPSTTATVLLAHGFQRRIADMDLVARHYASWGLPVVTVSLCSNSFLGVDHPLNGRAMAAAGQALAPDGRLYAGFSAGGLAAYLAASEDAAALGFVGLDPVDAGAAVEAASHFSAPAWAILAGPQGCNAEGNWRRVLAAHPEQRALRVPAAAHVDFEREACGPTDMGCRFCAPTGGEAHRAVWRLTTAAMLVLTGAEPEAGRWLEAGGEGDGLVEEARSPASG